MLDLLLSNRLYPTGLEFRRFDAYTKTDGIILIVPGRYWAGHEADITDALARYSWVLGIRVGDEEDLFDIHQVRHPNLRWWVQTPRAHGHYGDARLIGLGFPPHLNELQDVDKSLDVFLAAQNTHGRRQEAFAALQPGPRRRIAPTEGFTKGLAPTEYARCMTSAKVAPCPSGAVSPDSFRVYEALEAHAIPIADDVSPAYDSRGYWQRLFPDAPFPILTDYANLRGWIDDLLADWPRNANRIAAWWIGAKRTLARSLRDDLEALGALHA